MHWVPSRRRLGCADLGGSAGRSFSKEKGVGPSPWVGRPTQQGWRWPCGRWERTTEGLRGEASGTGLEGQAGRWGGCQAGTALATSWARTPGHRLWAPACVWCSFWEGRLSSCKCLLLTPLLNEGAALNQASRVVRRTSRGETQGSHVHECLSGVSKAAASCLPWCSQLVGVATDGTEMFRTVDTSSLCVGDPRLPLKPQPRPRPWAPGPVLSRWENPTAHTSPAVLMVKRRPSLAPGWRLVPRMSRGHWQGVCSQTGSGRCGGPAARPSWKKLVQSQIPEVAGAGDSGALFLTQSHLGARGSSTCCLLLF